MDQIEFRHRELKIKGCRQPIRCVDLCVDGQPVGTAYFRVYNSYPLHYMPEVLVSPQVQGQGFGTRLILECSRWLYQSKVPALTFNVHSGRGSQALYEGNGWTAVPNHPNWYAFNLERLRKPVDQVITRL